MSAAEPDRALVVDDAPTIRLYHAQTLRAQGFEVLEAADGVEGLEVALSRRPQLLLVDVNMPRMDGYAMLRAIRAEPEIESVPAIMISTEKDESDADQAFAAGANLYLSKPADPVRLGRLACLLVGKPLP